MFLFLLYFFFFFNYMATTEIYTLSLHDALPIFICPDDALHQLVPHHIRIVKDGKGDSLHALQHVQDRKSTRLNSSHANISYAVFCLKKKKHEELIQTQQNHLSRKRATTHSYDHT